MKTNKVLYPKKKKSKRKNKRYGGENVKDTYSVNSSKQLSSEKFTSQHKNIEPNTTKSPVENTKQTTEISNELYNSILHDGFHIGDIYVTKTTVYNSLFLDKFSYSGNHAFCFVGNNEVIDAEGRIIYIGFDDETTFSEDVYIFRPEINVENIQDIGVLKQLLYQQGRKNRISYFAIKDFLLKKCPNEFQCNRQDIQTLRASIHKLFNEAVDKHNVCSTYSIIMSQIIIYLSMLPDNVRWVTYNNHTKQFQINLEVFDNESLLERTLSILPLRHSKCTPNMLRETLLTNTNWNHCEMTMNEHPSICINDKVRTHTYTFGRTKENIVSLTNDVVREITEGEKIDANSPIITCFTENGFDYYCIEIKKENTNRFYAVIPVNKGQTGRINNSSRIGLYRSNHTFVERTVKGTNSKYALEQISTSQDGSIYVTDGLFQYIFNHETSDVYQICSLEFFYKDNNKFVFRKTLESYNNIKKYIKFCFGKTMFPSFHFYRILSFMFYYLDKNTNNVLDYTNFSGISNEDDYYCLKNNVLVYILQYHLINGRFENYSMIGENKNARRIDKFKGFFQYISIPFMFHYYFRIIETRKWILEK